MRDVLLLQLSQHDVSEMMQLVHARLRQTNAIVGDTLRVRRHHEYLGTSQSAYASIQQLHKVARLLMGLVGGEVKRSHLPHGQPRELHKIDEKFSVNPSYIGVNFLIKVERLIGLWRAQSASL